ncbi:MAG: glycosyltransferase family 25 protein [Flavobacteriia bacterium]|nr:glycosyltransferase family 25 protein [Flavobacteriia bacterium]
MEFLQYIPVVMIHREKDKEREFFMETFEKKLGIDIQRVEAQDGEELLKTQEIPRKHPRDREETSVGNIGCTFSHVSICETFLETEHDHICIFEDDVELVSDSEDLFDYIEYSNELAEWDILFLGTNEIVEGTPLKEQPLISDVKRFWGTHAVILTRKAAQAIVHEFQSSVVEGYALPADWLYSFAIQHQKLIAYCPTESRSYVQQKENLVSTCTGKLRVYSK